MKLKEGKQIQIRIEHLGSRGEGIGHFEDQRVFVTKTAPQDEVLIRVLEKRRGQWQAEKVKLLTESPQRVTPNCRHFEECGGCDFQHLSYHDQIEWKKNITHHWLNRSPLQPYLKGVHFDALTADDSYHYRNRVRIQFKNGKPCFYKTRSRDPISLEECPILEEGFFQALQQEAREKKNAQDQMYTWASQKLISKHEEGTYQINQASFQFRGNSFVQASWKMNQKMYTRLQDDLHDLKSKKLAWDLFCGVGNFTAALLEKFVDVIGVESFLDSIQLAQKNFPKCQWRHQHVDDFIRQEHNRPDFVLMDPPRSGALEASRSLTQVGPQKITYVSCQLDSLIRDLTPLVKKGGYQITRWTTVDLFPQTKHIESIVSLTKVTKR